MQITLKQREIEAALRLYVTQNGISLVGKTVDIGFTAGRKEGGLIADISIEDTNQADETPVKPVSIVSAEPVQAAAEQATAAAPAADTTVTEEVAAGDANVKSLFG